MKCPDCGGKLRIDRTYHKSAIVTRHYFRCEGCGKRGSILSQFEGFTSGKRQTALDALLRWDIRPEKATELVKHHPARQLKAYSENLPAIKTDYEQQTGRAVRDDAGFLVWAIENGWPLPTQADDPLPVDLPPVVYYDPPPPPVLSEDEKIWRMALGQLQMQMTEATFNAWLKNTKTLPRKNGKMLVEAQTPFAKDWLEKRLIFSIKRTLEKIEPGLEVEFICSPQP